MSATFNHGYALLIGVGECVYKPLSLPVTVKDTQAIYAALIDRELCGYPQENIQVLNNTEATHEGILKGLSWLKEKTVLDKEATAIVYYSGHGWVDKTDSSYYLLQHDVKPSKLATSALSAEVFTNGIREIESDRVLVVIDSCHAAGMATSKDGEAMLADAELMAEFDGFDRIAPSKGFIDDLKQGKGRAVFTSSTGEQKSHWFNNGSMSIYTFHFLEALQGAGNQPGDEQVKVSNLMSHLDKTVNKTALRECNEEQIPCFDMTSEGSFAIARLGENSLHNKRSNRLTPEASPTINNKNIKYKIKKVKSIHEGDVINNNNFFDFSSLFRGFSDRRNRKKEAENRKALLDSVHRTWVGDFSDLDIPLKLGLKKRLDLVESALTPASKLQQGLPPNTRIIDLFDSKEMGYQLLILGNPGAGKSTALRELAKDLINRAKEDEELPIPVAFYLPRWNPKQSLEKWMISEFSSNKYPTSEPTNRRWIKDEKLLFLLEGLDEVRGDRQAACVEAINKFIDDYKLTKIIVFSRLEEYEKLPVRLQFHSALLIKPLKKEQVYEHLQYLQSSGMNLQGILSALQSDPQLLKLAKTPLFLSIISKAYEGVEVERLPPEQNHEEHVQYLFENYVDRMTTPPKDKIRHPEPTEDHEKNENDPDLPRNRRKHKQNKLTPTYSKKETIAWLQFLARNIPNNMFLIEEINPTWLPNNLLWQYRLGVGLIAGIIMEFYGLVIGLINGVVSYQMLSGLFVGMGLGFFNSMKSEVKVIDSFSGLSWYWSREKAFNAAKPALWSILVITIITILLYFLPTSINMGHWSFSLGLISGILSAIISGLLACFVATSPKTRTTTPNQAIYKAFKRTLIVTGLSFFIFMLLTLWTNSFIPLSVLLGCIGLYSGGLEFIQHWTIRMLLWKTYGFPYHYKVFFEHVKSRSLMRQSGGRYAFIHNLLYENLASKNRRKNPKLVRQSYSQNIITLGVTGIVFLISLFPSIAFNSWKVSSNTVAQLVSSHLQVNNRIVTDRFSHRMGWLLNKGDIVTFWLKKEAILDLNKTILKILEQLKGRKIKGEIIGCPGDQVSIDKDKLAINGSPLELIIYIDSLEYPFIVPANTYLVITKQKDEIIFANVSSADIEERAVLWTKFTLFNF